MAVTRNNYVLIDFENVQLMDISKLAGLPVKVFLFIGENQKNISKDLLKQACSHPGILSVVESVGSGKNALDFQIALHAGIICERDKDAYIHFVSKDKGFDILVDLLRSQKRFAARADKFDDLRLIKISSAALTSSVDVQAQLIADKIIKGTKPRKRSTLESTISATFGKEIQASDIVDALIKKQLISIDESNKVTYSASILQTLPNKAGEPMPASA